MFSKSISSASAPHAGRVPLHRFIWSRLLTCFFRADRPAARPTAAIDQPASPAPEARVADRAVPPTGATVLLIAHDPGLCQWLRAALLRAEYTVLVGGSGQEALELLDKHPDLVVIERRLPDVDGLELCRLLHDQSHAPIVMFAPSADKRDTILALENGADDVIDDVSSPPVLVARVRAVLRRYPQRKPGV